MKKTIFILLLLIFLTGCSNQNVSIDNGNLLEAERIKVIENQIRKEHEQWRKEWETLMIKNNSKYPEAKMSISVTTGSMLWDDKTKAPHEVSFLQNAEEKQNGWKISIVTGYIYTYKYDDLGLKINTSELYEPYFFEKSDKPLIKRNGNIIYNASNDSGIIGWDYIEVFFKDPKKPFEDEIKEKQLPAGCTIGTGIAVDHPISKHIKGFQEIAISSIDGNFAGDENCKLDKQLPGNLMYISFYMDPKKPDRYYKFSYGDCAPGPCSIFGDIEFF
ncbi:MAG: hypothetical protein CO170_02995 [candidate division SR1 bacterium CG_4_9_14_3_um_filter_40_9]|nr:MAG: hypothetical protein CO170_02995 [candidate division SR1 bacterium CG_4_9_14_3_um_filter_40_9]